MEAWIVLKGEQVVSPVTHLAFKGKENETKAEYLKKKTFSYLDKFHPRLQNLTLFPIP